MTCHIWDRFLCRQKYANVYKEAHRLCVDMKTYPVYCKRGLSQLPDCPTIPISSGLSQFCLKISNSDQYAIGIGKIPISTHVVIFSSNSHKRKRNAEYLTLMSRKTEETARNYRRCLTEVVVLEHQKWHFRASRFKNFLGGGMPAPRPP